MTPPSRTPRRREAATSLPRFIPRTITKESAALGYNNAGRGNLIGYISDPKQHEISCPHFKDASKTCACRVGLWQEKVPPTTKKRISSPKRGKGGRARKK